jgi:Protein of unknown function (DUF3551)
MTRFSAVLLAALAIVAAAALARPAAAIEYPWCAQYGDKGGGIGRNCGFSTYQQCMDTVRGIGGYCERNLFYTGRAERPAKRARRRGND